MCLFTLLNVLIVLSFQITKECLLNFSVMSVTSNHRMIIMEASPRLFMLLCRKLYKQRPRPQKNIVLSIVIDCIFNLYLQTQ